MKRMLLISLLAFNLMAEESELSPRYLVHLLDYISIDYPAAVEDEKVVNAQEYAEMKEFAKTAIQLAEQLPEIKGNVEIAQGLRELAVLIDNRKSIETISKVARSVEGEVIRLSQIEVSPKEWPDRTAGKNHYAQMCASCHGVTGHGDGPSGTDLDPKPANFHDGSRMAGIPPFLAFNAIRLGISGTGMAAFHQLSDKEVWDLAFYVVSMRHEEKLGQSTGVGSLRSEPLPLSLKELATLSDGELAGRLTGSAEEKATQIASLRLYQPLRSPWPQYLQLARTHLQEALSAVAQEDRGKARNLALLAYLDGIEPVEPKLRAIDRDLIFQIEKAMAEVRGAIEQNRSHTEVSLLVQDAITLIGRIEAQFLKTETTSPWLSFSMASGIFMREALEAVLILITVLGVVRAVGSQTAALYVHAGWILALFCGVVGWFFSGWLLSMSGAQREVLEGAVSLLAVAVLLYFGFWLHRRTEIGRWQLFISHLVKTAVDGKRLIGLFLISFMAVFREAFETVLFLRAVVLEAGHEGAVLSGVAVTFVGVVILSALLIRVSLRLPIRRLFQVSSTVLVLLSVVLTGKGIHALQEAGWVGIHYLPLQIRWELLGILPTYETLVPQVVILMVIAAVGYWGKTPTLQLSTSN